MNFNMNQPIYSQVVEMILKQIVTGELKPNDKLASVRSLSETCMVNMNTVQKAYAKLEQLDIIYVQRGVGNFVVDDQEKINVLKKQMVKERLNQFMNEMQDFKYSKEEIINLIKEQKQ